MGVDRTSMVASIDELEGKGLVERRPDPNDRRRNIVTLTASGAKTTQQGAAASTKAERAFFEPLSEDDAITIKQALRVLAFPHENSRTVTSAPRSG
jgi:DNA-binding MarR family transcriptional regulator